MDNRAIGIFDSGLGGLTALRALRALLPDENIVYFADTARMPYGDRRVEELRKMTQQDLAFLTRRGVKCVLAACGTVSSTAPDVLDGCMIKAFDVLRPTVREAAGTGNGPVGVIATEASIRSGAYQRALVRLCPGREIVAAACPAYVPLIESGSPSAGEELRAATERYLRPFADRSVKTLILGCTHYGLIADTIRAFLGNDIYLIEASACAAKAVAGYLKENDLCGGTGEERFFTSGSTEAFRRLSAVFFGGDEIVKDITHVPAEEV